MAKQNKKLVDEARWLGIDVDGRWSDETIQERIDVVTAQRAEEGQGGEGAASGGEAAGAGSGQSAVAVSAGAETDVAGGEATAEGTGAPELSLSDGGDAGPAAGSSAGVAVGSAGAGGHAVEHDALGLVSDEAPIGAGDGYVRTDDVATADEIRELFLSDEADDEFEDEISTHDGDWRREGDVWRFWKHPDADDEEGDSTAEAGAGAAGGGDLAAGAGEGVVPAGGSDQGAADLDRAGAEPHVDDAGSAGGADPEPAGVDTPAGGLDGDPAGAMDAADADGDQPPADWPGDAERARQDEIEAVQFAMTKPILAAFQAACSVQGVLAGESTEHFSIDTSWMPGEEHEDRIINLVKHAAPFVRQWPDAPVDALYGHVASDGGLNLVLDVIWTDLDLPARLAWSTFRDTLIAIDRGVAAEKAAAPAEDPGPRRVPIDETTLERIEGSFERTEIAGGPR